MFMPSSHTIEKRTVRSLDCAPFVAQPSRPSRPKSGDARGELHGAASAPRGPRVVGIRRLGESVAQTGRSTGSEVKREGVRRRK